MELGVSRSSQIARFNAGLSRGCHELARGELGPVEPELDDWRWAEPARRNGARAPPQNWRTRHFAEYDKGWDAVRRARLKKEIELGIMPADTQLSERMWFVPDPILLARRLPSRRHQFLAPGRSGPDTASRERGLFLSGSHATSSSCGPP